MTVPPQATWREVSDQIISNMATIDPQDRLRFLQEQLNLLPPDAQEMVGHFVTLAVTVHDSGGAERVAMGRQRHISGIAVMALILALALGVGGIYLVKIGNVVATSNIKVWGAEIQTTSVGVACMALGMFLFLFVARKAIATL